MQENDEKLELLMSRTCSDGMRAIGLGSWDRCTPMVFKLRNTSCRLLSNACGSVSRRWSFPCRSKYASFDRLANPLLTACSGV